MATRSRGAVFALIVLVGALALSSCSSAPSPIAKKATPTTIAPSLSAHGVRSAWNTFFASSSSAGQKVAVLENGSQFVGVIDAQAKSALAKQVSVSVQKVTVAGTKAIVTYTILVAGAPVLKDIRGQAVELNGLWKVADSSFCALLSLEQLKVAACPSSTSK